MWLYAIVAVFMVAAYLFAPSITNETPAPASLGEFNYPDNSSGKPIPRIYGTARVSGNCIYVGGLRSRKIEKCG